MSEGIAVEVVDGYATIEFVDRETRGEGIASLLEAAGDPTLVQKRTRPTVAYIVPEDVARAAGLLDDAPLDALIGLTAADDDPAQDNGPQLEQFAGGGIVETPENAAPSTEVPGVHVASDGTETAFPAGAPIELVGDGTGQMLPEVENPDGTVELEPAEPTPTDVLGTEMEQPAPEPPAEAPAPTQGYDDGLPDMDWSRKAINEYAANLTPPLDVTGFGNKRDALTAIRDRKAAETS